MACAADGGMIVRTPLVVRSAFLLECYVGAGRHVLLVSDHACLNIHIYGGSAVLLVCNYVCACTPLEFSCNCRLYPVVYRVDEAVAPQYKIFT